MPRSVPTDSKRDAADNKREARPSAPPRPRLADGGSKAASRDNRVARALLCFLAALIIFVFLKFSDHTGFIGRYIHKALFYCFGMAGYVLPVIFLMCAFKAWSGKLPEKLNVKLVSLLLLADSVFFASKCGEQGGVLGSALNQLFAGILGNAVSWGLAIAGLIAAVYLWWDFSVGEACELAKEVWAVLGEAFKKAGVFIGAALLLCGRLLKSVFSKLMRLAGLLFGDGSEPSGREGGSGDALRSSEGEDSGQYEESGSLSDFGAQERASASQGKLSGNVDESLDPLGFPKMDSFDKYKDSAKSAEPGGDGRRKENGAVSRNINMRSRQDSLGGDGNRELMSDPESQSPPKRAAASEKPYGREAAAQAEAEEHKPDPDIFKYEAADGERQDFTRCQPEYLYKLSAVQRRVLLGLLRERSEQGGSGREDKSLPKAVNRRQAQGPFSSGSCGDARSAGGNEPPRDKYDRSGAGEAFLGENQEDPFQRRQKQDSDSGVSAPLSKEDKLRALGIIPRRGASEGAASAGGVRTGSAAAGASGSASQSPASLKGMSNEEKRRALGIIPRRSSGNQSAPASAGSDPSQSASAGASGSAPQSPASLKGMSNEEKRRALGIIPRRGSGNQSAPASAGSGPAQAASAGASGSASQSPASLKGMSNEEKRRALGIIPRRGSAQQSPKPQPAAAEKAENPGEQSFSSISPAALNAMSPADRMKALGLKKRSASEQPDSMEAVKKLRQADGRIAVDSKAALETLGAKGARRPAAVQSLPQEASVNNNARHDSAAKAGGAEPVNRASAPAPRCGSGLRKLTPEEKAAEREKALRLRESYRRQAENRARMLKTQSAGRPQADSDAMGGNDLSDRSPMLAPPADSKKNAFSPDAEPSLLKKNELTPENGLREAFSGPEERDDDAADAGKEPGGEPAEVRNPKESEGNFYTEGGVFGYGGESEAFEEEVPVLSRSIAEFSAAVGQIKGLSWQAGEDLDDLLGTSETVKAERTGFSAAEAEEPYRVEAENIYVGNEASDAGAESASEQRTGSLETVREADAEEYEYSENSTDEYAAEDSTDENASAEDSTDEYAAEDGDDESSAEDDTDDYAAESSAYGYASAENNTDEYGGEDDTDEYASAEDSTGDYAADDAGSSYEGEPSEETEADSVEADGEDGAADSGRSDEEILISRKTAEFPVIFNAETSFAEDASARPAPEDSLDGEGLSAVSFDSIMPRNRADITNLRPFNIHGSEVFRNPIRAEFFDVRAENGRNFADADSASRGGERTGAGMPAAAEPYRSASEAPAVSAGSLSVSVNCRPEIVPDIRPAVFVQSAASESKAAVSEVSAAPQTAGGRPAQPAAAPADRPAPSASAAPGALPESSAPAAPAAPSAAAVPAASAPPAGGALTPSREELDSRSAAPAADNAFERGAQERGGVSRSASFGYTGVKRIIGSGNPSGSGSAFGFRSEGGTGASGAGPAAPHSAPPPQRSGSSDSQPSLPAAAGQYYLPSINLLDKAPDSGRPRNFVDKSELLVKTLNSFKVKATVKNVIQGPAVTRYELEPAPGVRVNKITNLSSDIALALAAKNIRIEAPVPGKSAVGIEVPNEETEMVALKDVLDSEAFRGGKGLCCGLGKDITGQVRAADLSRMPHLLVAGTTGSGKSVCINTLILSLIYRFTPRRLQLLMIDPKQVELSIYEGLPHLINLSGEEPGKIIVDPKTASAALKQMVELMEDRYTVFAKNRVRKIEEYNQKHPDKAMPWVVIIIDELADLMMVSSKEVETSICRLAQKARAAGIHMVVATQRPSTDVITGLMKVNIPSRIAFAVSSGVDSRVILDQGGAEHLLGKGDMLFKPVEANEPARIQGAFVNNNEIQRVVDFWTAQAAPDNLIKLEIQDEAVEDSSDKGGSDSDDPMLEEALEVVLRRGQASASMLQTDLRVGYARARRLLNLLEEQGYVGPAEGSKPRKILYTGGSRG